MTVQLKIKFQLISTTLCLGPVRSSVTKGTSRRRLRFPAMPRKKSTGSQKEIFILSRADNSPG